MDCYFLLLVSYPGTFQELNENRRSQSLLWAENIQINPVQNKTVFALLEIKVFCSLSTWTTLFSKSQIWTLVQDIIILYFFNKKLHFFDIFEVLDHKSNLLGLTFLTNWFSDNLCLSEHYISIICKIANFSKIKTKKCLSSFWM